MREQTRLDHLLLKLVHRFKLKILGVHDSNLVVVSEVGDSSDYGHGIGEDATEGQ
jgi:hypothetical protein